MGLFSSFSLALDRLVVMSEVLLQVWSSVFVLGKNEGKMIEDLRYIDCFILPYPHPRQCLYRSHPNCPIPRLGALLNDGYVTTIMILTCKSSYVNEFYFTRSISQYCSPLIKTEALRHFRKILLPYLLPPCCCSLNHGTCPLALCHLLLIMNSTRLVHYLLKRLCVD